jgi:tetratricopeptide (TPR) repeat protein
MAQLQRRLPRLPHLGLIALLGAGAASAPARASAPSASASAAATPTPARALATLPEVPKIVLPPPSASDLEDLDGVLGRLRGEDATARETAATEVLEAKPSWVAAIDKRMNEIADKTNRDDMRRVLEGARTKARTAEREKLEASGKRGKIETPDYLAILVQNAQPKSKPWGDTVAVVAMSRMLATIGTVEAARELIDVHTRFGDFLRVDVQLQLSKMGDKAVAALIEARKHKAEKIAKWAVRHLDSMGKAIPSEAVQTEDHQVLADVLRAYGRVRDPDAARIVISFANTERAQVREAARQAVAMMGDVANWQLRDSYEDLLGKKPPRDWTWDRTARELFGELDRQRLAQVYTLYDQGLRARQEGKLAEMRAAWDQVLTRNPSFEHREEMAQGYLALAKSKLDDDRPTALSALRRAERLTANTDDKKRIESLALTLEGEELAAKGVADQVLFNRAIELDPDNGRAKDALGRLARGEIEKKSAVGRWGGALAIALGALIAIVLIALRRGKPEPAPAPPAAPAENETEAASEPEEPEPEEPAAEAADDAAGVPAPAGEGADEDQK